MGIYTQVTDQKSFVNIRVVGDYDRELFMGLVGLIKEEGLRSKSKRVLFDVRGVNNLFNKNSERSEFGMAIGKALGQDVMVAGLASPDIINHFAELVANMHGGNTKVFSSEDAARQWLLEETVLSVQYKAQN